MLDRANLVQLMKTVAKADPSSPVAYSWGDNQLNYRSLNETLRQELNELAGSWNLYRQNKDLIFSIIEEVLNDILPEKVTEQYERFAEVRTFRQGDKPLFRRRLTDSNSRAKQFITRVGLEGVYEVFKLSPAEEVFEVRTSAIGGAAQIGLEEFLDGRVDFAEVTRIVMEAMDELIYREIGAALKASVNQLPAANRVAAAGFDENAFDKLLMIAGSYGTPTIYCTYEFAVNMIPTEAWRYTESMKDELWRTGRLQSYKGHTVIILKQGFEDATHTKKVIDPGYAWIIPTGADTKPVKVAFEGETLIREVDANQDWSRELQVYKKVGVVAMLGNNICVYTDTSLAGQMDTWHLSNDQVMNTVTVTNIGDAGKA